MRGAGLGLVVALAASLAACVAPEDRRPGMRLSGEVVATPPSDWAFTNEHREIAVQVRTPYLLPHSVTIWCAELDGALYLGAREPETKRWPGWVDRDPNVRLRIGSNVYEVTLVPVEDADLISRVRRAYAAKYQLPSSAPGEGPAIRYWRVRSRS